MNSNEVVLLVLAALERLDIAYMIVGSFSSNAYGRARSTQDADIVIELGKKTISDLTAALGSDFRMDPQSVLEFNTFTTRYIAQHVASAFKIEFFLLSDEPHDQARFARRSNIAFLNSQAWLPSPEDVVIWKLRWAQRAGRQKDREDAFMVLAAQAGRLDLPYMREWCMKHGTLPLLEQMLAAMPEPEQP